MYYASIHVNPSRAFFHTTGTRHNHQKSAGCNYLSMRTPNSCLRSEVTDGSKMNPMMIRRPRHLRHVPPPIVPGYDGFQLATVGPRQAKLRDGAGYMHLWIPLAYHALSLCVGERLVNGRRCEFWWWRFFRYGWPRTDPFTIRFINDGSPPKITPITTPHGMYLTAITQQPLNLSYWDDIYIN